MTGLRAGRFYFLQTLGQRLSFIVLIAVDQASKHWAVTHHLITESYNTGVSFGVFSQIPPLFLGIFLVAVLVALLELFSAFWSKYPYLGVLFFAGGISNILDRWWFGAVRDWLPLPGTGLYNNLADWYIAVAIIGLFLLELQQYVHKREQQAKPIQES